jgi:hypothetical protein
MTGRTPWDLSYPDNDLLEARLLKQDKEMKEKFLIQEEELRRIAENIQNEVALLEHETYPVCNPQRKLDFIKKQTVRLNLNYPPPPPSRNNSTTGEAANTAWINRNSGTPGTASSTAEAQRGMEEPLRDRDGRHTLQTATGAACCAFRFSTVRCSDRRRGRADAVGPRAIADDCQRRGGTPAARTGSGFASSPGASIPSVIPATPRSRP